jgi:glutamate synthase (NADPH/NADH) large chain
MEAYANHLRDIVHEYVAETGSAWGQHILDHFADMIGKFWLVKPKAASIEGLMADLRRVAA